MPIYNEETGRLSAWTFGTWVLAIIVFFTAISAVGGLGYWGFRVATAEFKGRGDARIRIESSTNRIEKQELFEELYAKIQAYDDQINIAATSTSPRAAENLQGLRLICIDATAQYNAEANKISSEQFRDSALPYQIDSISRDFDCKEDK